MSNELSKEIERINESIQNCRIQEQSLKDQKIEAEKRMAEIVKSCEEFSLNPEQLVDELEKLEKQMLGIIEELKNKIPSTS